MSFFICELFSNLAHTHQLKSSRRDGPVEKFTLTISRVQEFKSSRFQELKSSRASSRLPYGSRFSRFTSKVLDRFLEFFAGRELASHLGQNRKKEDWLLGFEILQIFPTNFGLLPYKVYRVYVFLDRFWP